jgi:hypothetical protein
VLGKEKRNRMEKMEVAPPLCGWGRDGICECGENLKREIRWRERGMVGSFASKSQVWLLEQVLVLQLASWLTKG